MLFAIFGVLFVFLAVLITDKLGIVSQFPAFAGEDDFTLRIKYFFLIVCPGFAAIGAWIGYAYSKDTRVSRWMWLGVVAGSIVTFAAVHIVSSMAELATRDQANYAVLAFYVVWILLAWLAALIFVKGVRTLNRRWNHVPSGMAATGSRFGSRPRRD